MLTAVIIENLLDEEGPNWLVGVFTDAETAEACQSFLEITFPNAYVDSDCFDTVQDARKMYPSRMPVTALIAALIEREVVA